ncbi:MAG: hypothetical protein N4A36_00730 [Candidatus Gracilibacteria bacterium]|nr:hypothetical protein [Candidatus Gracilibacteria bacterium]
MHELPVLDEYRDYQRGDYVIIMIPDIAEDLAIVRSNDVESCGEVKTDIKILRKATDQDRLKKDEAEIQAEQDFVVFREKIAKFKKEMSPVGARVSLDQRFFYATFTAPDRVDFRDMVKEFSSQVGKKVFFEQIGVRDRAKIVGDLGKCGQTRCCGSFLPTLPSVSMESARVQNLSSQQLENITGVCCKLKCCLNYEVENYKENRKDLPKMKKKVFYNNREGRVMGLDILNKRVKIQFDDTGEFLVVDNEKISRKEQGIYL